MNKDLEKGNIPKDAYLEASNFRIVTTEGLSSGAFENLQGTNVAHNSYDISDDFVYNGADCFPSGQYVVGSVRMRNTLIVFTTSNTSTTPSGGRSIIYKIVLDKDTEKITTITVVYDDSLNNSAGTLNFSTANRIKAVSRYETPEIQKVYWTDGYNRLRYIDIAKYNTTDGLVKSGANFYMSLDLLEFIPGIDLNKPYLSKMTTGSLKPGTVQYAYQYFRFNGAETTISPLSNTIHIVSTDDEATTSLYYIGEGDPDINTSRGCEITIDLSNSDKYTKVRLFRLHYSTLNAIPTITIVGELDIDSTMSDISFKDTGINVLSQLTIDEFNIFNTELFIAEDIEVKGNQLFAANITKDDIFTVDDWDSRAVRFRQVPAAGGSDTTTDPVYYTKGTDSTFTYSDDNTFTVVVPNFSDTITLPSGRVLTGITDVSVGPVGTNAVIGSHSSGTPFTSTIAETTTALVSYTGDVLTFTVSTSGTDYFSGVATIDSGSTISLLVLTYTYTTSSSISSLIESSTEADVSIAVPTDPTDPADWDTAGWVDYTEKYDGINPFNDTDNDFTATLQYKYQSDGTTLGAEGPNIKIGFTTDSLLLDESNQSATFWVGSESTATNKSYKSLASPFKSGKRSWQRDETYRLYIVFYDDRGRPSVPKWICDLRMPSLHDTGNYSKLAYLDGTDIYTEMLYPTVQLRSLPTGVESFQIFRVQRGANDRSVLTQGLVVPSDTSLPFRPTLIDEVVLSAKSVHKLVSPEININKNISYGSSDYLEFVTDFDDVVSGTFGDYLYNKTRENNIRTRTSNERTTLQEIKYVTPSQSVITIGGSTYTNYMSKYFTSLGRTISSYGSSGLAFYHLNSNWTVNNINYVLVNYKRNVFDSQYGGNTYNKRLGNIVIPCSDILTTTAVDYTCYNGDTFINFFDVSTYLWDLTKPTLESINQSIFFPVESSINLELQHGYALHRNISSNFFLAQETAGEWEDGSARTITQDKSMYQYNTVYSQESTAKFTTNISLENENPTGYDSMVKASNTKLNGEVSDSWTKFNINEYIEVDSQYGAIRALYNLNDKMIFWQENSMGLLSINERSLIQDNLTSKLSLGTGGVLDRYDYISTKIGIDNKESIVGSQVSVYWFYDKDTSLYRFAEGPENISKTKNMWSWFKNKYVSTYVVHGVYDSTYNEIIYTFYKPTDKTGYTLSFNEQVDKFVSFYDFIPSHYLDMNNFYLSSVYDTTGTREYLHFHNSELKPRCMFYSYTKPADADDLLVYDSEVHLLFNDDYLQTKVFDNIFYTSNAFDSSNVEIYNNSFTSVRAYNDYQNTHYIALTYGAGIENLQRRERGWTLVVPRNAVNTNYTSSPDIFDPANIAASREWSERMRDKYLIVEMIYDNEEGYKFIVPFIGMRYRISRR